MKTSRFDELFHKYPIISAENKTYVTNGYMEEINFMLKSVPILNNFISNQYKKLSLGL